jgi:hypothetical protein
MKKALRVLGFCASMILLVGTTAAACEHDAPAVAHEVEIDVGHNTETLNGSQLRAIMSWAHVSESLDKAADDISESEVPDEIKKATGKLAAFEAETVILNACARENLPSTPSPPVDLEPAVTQTVETDLQDAVDDGGGDDLAAVAVCQAAAVANSPH